MFTQTLILAIVVVFILFSTVTILISRYKKSKPNQVLVVYGKVGPGASSEKRTMKCIHGGAAFILPVIQAYDYLDLTPIQIDINLKNALSKQNIRVDAPAVFTVGISTENGIMQNAAERLLGLGKDGIEDLAKDIIFGQLRLVLATMNIEEINTDRDRFLHEVQENVEAELQKIGLRLINVNVTDINDESGYIESLGKEASSKAINDAKKTVAERDRDGSIGEANARKDQRISVAEADATAIEGENKSQTIIANSEAFKREEIAKAERKASAAEKVQAARALEESYEAEQTAELKRASREEATKRADILVPAEIEKQKMEVDAEAKAEETRRVAQGEADAIYSKLQAEARGNKEILEAQAEGFKKIIESAGGDPDKAISLMIAEKLPELVKMQTEAIQNLKIDKVTVWDSGKGANGKNSTSNFLSGMTGVIPPMSELFNNAGMEIPAFLGSKTSDEKNEHVENEEKTEAN